MHIYWWRTYKSIKFAERFEYHNHRDLETEVKVNLTKISISEVINKVLTK
jgi:hypothetical protein